MSAQGKTANPQRRHHIIDRGGHQRNADGRPFVNAPAHNAQHFIKAHAHGHVNQCGGKQRKQQIARLHFLPDFDNAVLALVYQQGDNPYGKKNPHRIN